MARRKAARKTTSSTCGATDPAWRPHERTDPRPCTRKLDHTGEHQHRRGTTVLARWHDQPVETMLLW